MLTTKTNNPQTQFSMEYYKMLMRSSKKQAEAYRLSVTAPKPNAIDVGKTRWIREHDVALSQDAVITNEQIQTKISSLRDVDQTPNVPTQTDAQVPIISDSIVSDNTDNQNDQPTIQPIHDIIGSVDVVGEVMNARNAELSENAESGQISDEEKPAETSQTLDENPTTTENSDKLDEAPKLDQTDLTPPEWAEVIDIKAIKATLRANGVTNANFLSEADAISKAKELNLL